MQIPCDLKKTSHILLKKVSSYLILCMCILFLHACTQKKEQKNIITVTIQPQKYFAEQLVDTIFEIGVIVPNGASPETYDPTPSQMTNLAQSKAYFKIGQIGFEKVWIDKIASNNPDLAIYDNSKGMSFIENHDEHECEEHNHAHHHHPEGIDPHIWSSPRRALQIVNNMYEALCELDPDNQQIYHTNLLKLETQITRIDSTVAHLLQDLEQRSFIIYHPALTYFAEDYNLKQYCIEMDGKEPSPTQLKKLVEKVKKENVRVVFIQKEFDMKNAEIIAKESGCELIQINPLAYDWENEIIKIAKALASE